MLRWAFPFSIVRLGNISLRQLGDRQIVPLDYIVKVDLCHSLLMQVLSALQNGQERNRLGDDDQAM